MESPATILKRSSRISLVTGFLSRGDSAPQDDRGMQLKTRTCESATVWESPQSSFLHKSQNATQNSLSIVVSLEGVANA